MRGNRQNGGVRALCIVETVDEMGVTRPARASTYSKFASHLRLSACGECGGFFMPHVNPVDTAVLRAARGTYRIHNRVQGIPHYPVDTLNACFDELSNHLFC